MTDESATPRDFVPVLHNMVAMGASDLHLKVGAAPTLRIDGQLFAIDEPTCKPAEIAHMMEQLLPPEKQLAFAQKLRWRSLRMIGIPRMGFFHTGELEKFLIESIGDLRFDELKLPLAVVATDFRTARPVIFRSGRVAPAVAASAAIPIVFSPVMHGEMVLVDGGLSNNLPSDIARQMGADIVLGVSVLSVFDEKRRYQTFFDIALGTMDLMARTSNEIGSADCDLCLAPLRGPRSPSDLARAPSMVAEGEAAMLRALPRLRELLES